MSVRPFTFMTRFGRNGILNQGTVARLDHRVWSHAIKTYVGDKSGTEVDILGLCPVHAIKQGHAKWGVNVSDKEVRAPMGGAKIKHIEAMRAQPQIDQQFRSKFMTPPDSNEVYQSIVPTQLKLLSSGQYGQLLPGVKSSLDQLARWGLDRTATTGYTSEMVNHVLKDQASQGYVPDCTVASDQVMLGRPWPFGIWRCMLKVSNGQVKSVLKVDDTAEGIKEGRAAGCPTALVIKYGNLMGAHFETPEALFTCEQNDSRKFNTIMDLVREQAYNLRPDFVMDTMESLPGVIQYIDEQANLNGTFSSKSEIPFKHIMDYIQKAQESKSLVWPDIQYFVNPNVASQKDQIICAIEFIRMVDQEYKLSVSQNASNLQFLEHVKDCLGYVKADKFVPFAEDYLSKHLPHVGYPSVAMTSFKFTPPTM